MAWRRISTDNPTGAPHQTTDGKFHGKRYPIENQPPSWFAVALTRFFGSNLYDYEYDEKNLNILVTTTSGWKIRHKYKEKPDVKE